MVDPKPIRILGDAPTKILDSENYLESISVLAPKVQESVNRNRPHAQIRFLAVTIYPIRHSYFVLDLNNDHYDFETAHTEMIPVPVYVLRLSRNTRIFRFQDQDEKLAARLVEMHNGHGWATRYRCSTILPRLLYTILHAIFNLDTDGILLVKVPVLQNYTSRGTASLPPGAGLALIQWLMVAGYYAVNDSKLFDLDFQYVKVSIYVHNIYRSNDYNY